MKKCILAGALSLNLFAVGGCAVDEITDYRNETLESFWASRSLNNERFKPYQLDGIHVSLDLPHEGYEHHNVSLALVAPSTGATIEVLRLQIRNLGFLRLETVGEIKVDSQIKDTTLFEAERVIAKNVGVEKLKQAAKAGGGNVEAILSIRIRRNGAAVEKDIVFPFERKVRKYLHMR
jgi:hypothetical protein